MDKDLTGGGESKMDFENLNTLDINFSDPHNSEQFYTVVDCSK